MQTLVTLVVIIIFLLLTPTGIVGQQIQLLDKIKVDSTADFKTTPRSFCVTEDGIFLFPDSKAGVVKSFGQEGKSLEFIDTFGRNGDAGNRNKFAQPMYCFYDQYDSKLGVIDYGVRKVFIFSKSGMVDFTPAEPIKEVPCKLLGYDIKLSGDGNQLVVSGSVFDNQRNPFDLYSINLKTGHKNYLIPSYEKYNLKTNEDFWEKYGKNKAIGIKAFFDIQGDDLFYVWEGLNRIVKLNLRSREVADFHIPAIEKTPRYIRPVASRLTKSYAKGDDVTTTKEKKKMSYVRDIFATPGHIFLVYEAGKNDKNEVSTFRLQTFSREGTFLDDRPIPGNPSGPMWLDKESYELYALSKEPKNDKSEFLILKYKIKR